VRPVSERWIAVLQFTWCCLAAYGNQLQPEYGAVAAMNMVCRLTCWAILANLSFVRPPRQVMTLYAALQLSVSTNVVDVKASLDRLNIDTIYAKVAFDKVRVAAHRSDEECSTAALLIRLPDNWLPE